MQQAMLNSQISLFQGLGNLGPDLGVPLSQAYRALLKLGRVDVFLTARAALWHFLRLGGNTW